VVKKVLTQAQEEILNEISLLKNEITPLSFCQKQKAPQVVYVNKLDATGNMLVLLKPEEFNAEPGKHCFVFFHPLGRFMTCFQSEIIEDGYRYLAISLPRQLYQICRRKCPRVETPPDSKTIFFKYSRPDLNHAVVMDISMEGAKLACASNPMIRPEEVFGPVEFNLCLRHDSHTAFTLTVPEAKIVWQKEKESGMMMGVCFKLKETNANHERLKRYIDMLTLEKAVLAKNE